MLKFSSFLIEGMGALTPTQLDKPNGKTKEARIDILRNAAINGTTLQLAKDNSEIVIANTPENLTAIAAFDGKKAIPLTTKDGKEITSSKLGKSAIFGGGAGAGGGTDNTAQTESAQCLWISAMLKHGANKPIEYFTPSILKDGMKGIDVGKTDFKTMIDQDPAWAISSYLSAQKIIAAGYANSRHEFHRDSKKMNFIYDAKSAAFKNTQLSVLSHDKWNPGDIWAIEKGLDLNKELDTSSIGALNTAILRLFKDRKLVGISLKLVKKEAKAAEYNIDKSPQDHKYQEGKAKSNRGTFFSNKGGVLVYSGGEMEIRPNNYLGANKIEISGKTARGGGAGWGVIIAAAKRYMRVNIPKHGSIKRIAQKLASGKNKKADLYFYKMAKISDPSLTYDYYLEQKAEKDAGWFSAKLAAVMIIYYLNQNRGPKADAFINAIVNYAASSTDDSSAFVKIYQ